MRSLNSWKRNTLIDSTHCENLMLSGRRFEFECDAVQCDSHLSQVPLSMERRVAALNYVHDFCSLDRVVKWLDQAGGVNRISETFPWVKTEAILNLRQRERRNRAFQPIVTLTALTSGRLARLSIQPGTREHRPVPHGIQPVGA